MTMGVQNMEEKVMKLIDEEKALKVYQDRYDEMKKQFEEENRDIIQILQNQKQYVEDLKGQVREAALVEYGDTGENKLFGGVGIKNNTKITYEVEDLMKWAEKNMPVLIKPTCDTKAFEKYCKPLISKKTGLIETPGLDFVKIEVTPLATLPSTWKV